MEEWELLLRSGTPDGKPERYPICPVCGLECSTIYRGNVPGRRVIYGCENCLDGLDAWGAEECFVEAEGPDEEYCKED